jgi:hypothetical protein
LDNLAEAQRLVEEAKAAVERQNEAIDWLVRDGHQTGEALGELAGLTGALLVRLKALDDAKARAGAK